MQTQSRLSSGASTKLAPLSSGRHLALSWRGGARNWFSVWRQSSLWHFDIVETFRFETEPTNWSLQWNLDTFQQRFMKPFFFFSKDRNKYFDWHKYRGEAVMWSFRWCSSSVSGPVRTWTSRACWTEETSERPSSCLWTSWWSSSTAAGSPRCSMPPGTASPPPPSAAPPPPRSSSARTRRAGAATGPGGRAGSRAGRSP